MARISQHLNLQVVAQDSRTPGIWVSALNLQCMLGDTEHGSVCCPAVHPLLFRHHPLFGTSTAIGSGLCTVTVSCFAC